MRPAVPGAYRWLLPLLKKAVDDSRAACYISIIRTFLCRNNNATIRKNSNFIVEQLFC